MEPERISPIILTLNSTVRVEKGQQIMFKFVKINVRMTVNYTLQQAKDLS
jgi:hypothetical protein